MAVQFMPAFINEAANDANHKVFLLARRVVSPQLLFDTTCSRSVGDALNNPVDMALHMFSSYKYGQHDSDQARARKRASQAEIKSCT